MGNCCGKQSSDNFHGEGRTLGATPANAPPPSSNARAAAPKSKISVSSGGRTLGASAQGAGDGSDPKTAAARAAEERVKASQGKGKLGKALDAQKSQTQADALAQAARDNLAVRNADAAQERQNYN